MINKTNIYKTSNNVSTGIVRSSLLSINRLKSVLPLNLPRVNKDYLVGFIDSHIIHYPSPISLTYAWSFGSLAGLCLVIQMVSGIFLAMHYTPHVDLAFSSVEHIMRDVNNGWLIRYIHANGASMFFILVYSHICRGLYYGSYMKPRELLWCSGVLILFLMMGTAFTGYVLPWGQMSFWGATVITSMVTAIPIAGQPIVQWLWGGYTVGNPTLNRFFSLHFVLPFAIAGSTIVHLALLHKDGSNSPIGSDTGVDDLPFYPYFAVKDVFAFFCFMLFFATFVFYFPNVLNHPDNCIPADPLQTPAHVVPEWYFLPYYAILRAIPHKVGGILAMVGSYWLGDSASAYQLGFKDLSTATVLSLTSITLFILSLMYRLYTEKYRLAAFSIMYMGFTTISLYIYMKFGGLTSGFYVSVHYVTIFMMYECFFIFTTRFLLRTKVILKGYWESREFIKLILWILVIFLPTLFNDLFIMMAVFSPLFMYAAFKGNFLLLFLLTGLWGWLFFLAICNKFNLFTGFLKKVTLFFSRRASLHFLGNTQGSNILLRTVVAPAAAGAVVLFAPAVVGIVNDTDQGAANAGYNARERFADKNPTSSLETKHKHFVKGYESYANTSASGRLLRKLDIIAPASVEAVNPGHPDLNKLPKKTPNYKWYHSK